MRLEKCFAPSASGQTDPFRIIIADMKQSRDEQNRPCLFSVAETRASLASVASLFS
jgi:hypothetical protein